MFSLSKLFVSVAIAASGGVLDRDTGPPSLAAPDRTATPPAATARLSEILRAAFVRNPDVNQDNYWGRNDFDRFWAELVGLLERGADVNAVYRDGVSVWNAAFVGDPRCECAPYGWPGFVTKKCPNPKYFRACEKQDSGRRESRVAILLQHGVDPNLNVLSGSSKPIGTPLCFATGTGLWGAVDLLIARGASCAASCGGYTLLHVAAENGDPKLLCQLLACGAPTDGRDDRGRTPLAVAAEGGFPRATTILLDYGSDPHATTTRGDDVIGLAQNNKRTAVTRLLQRWSKGKGEQATHSLCAR